MLVDPVGLVAVLPVLVAGAALVAEVVAFVAWPAAVPAERTAGNSKVAARCSASQLNIVDRVAQVSCFAVHYQPFHPYCPFAGIVIADFD